MVNGIKMIFLNISELKNDLHCNCIQRQHRFVSDVPVGFSL